MKILIICLLLIQQNSQKESPDKHFGDSYFEALEICKKQKHNFELEFKDTDISPQLAMAIVFPEIIRYNRFQNFFETSALELLYIKGGSEAADFSIGWFQMKPSFVEMLENELIKTNINIYDKDKFLTFTDNTNPAKRKERLKRLEQPKWQLHYLRLFISLARERFAHQIKQEPTKELLILSTAYNKGLTATYNEIEQFSKLKTFPYGKRFKCFFSYYEVSDWFYKNNVNGL